MIAVWNLGEMLSVIIGDIQRFVLYKVAAFLLQIGGIVFCLRNLSFLPEFLALQLILNRTH